LFGYPTDAFFETDDSYAGESEMLSGQPVARDLVFRTWVRP
jgi:hypothetical protein